MKFTFSSPAKSKSCIYLMIVLSLILSQCKPDNTSTNNSSSPVISTQDTLQKLTIHEPTGLIMDETFPLIIAHCTSCHSAKLVTQNRATRAGWAAMIDWMQETQGLWKFDEQEPQILDYLSTYYGPVETGRRQNLAVEEWYDLN